jgi:ketosteroid isomerase-like protein
MRIFRPLPLVIFVTAAPVRAQDAPDLARQVFAAESAFAHTLAARDLAAFGTYVALDAVFFGGNGPQRGRAAVVAAWQSFFDGPTPPFSWSPETVEVLASGTLAHSSGPVLSPAGRRIGTFNSVWRLEPDGRWRVVFDKGCPVCDRGPAALAPAHATALADSARQFALAVARDVSQEGPAAWRRHFADHPGFFMAVDGHLEFPSSDSAGRVISGLARTITHMELRWGETLRVDPVAPGLAMVAGPYHEVRTDTTGRRVEEAGYFTGLAEHRGAGWRFRNAHWSLEASSPAVR